MGRRYERQEILERLQATIERGQPVLGSGAGCGLVAKCVELGGVDLIFALALATTRMKGLPSPILPDNNNQLILDMFEELSVVTHKTPIIASIEAAEPPAHSDLQTLVNRFIDTGYSGVLNFPTSGMIHEPEFLHQAAKEEQKDESQKMMIKGEKAMFKQAEEKETVGLGYAREVEMMRICRELDIFTVAYVFTPEQAKLMAESGVDCVAGHCGGTTGGLTGHTAQSHEQAAIRLRRMFEAAVKANPNVILLAHAGPFAFPEDTRYLYSHTNAMGFIGGSAMERIPIEKAIIKTVEEFKQIPTRSIS